jgi:putative CocE/NonD family hydrolase
LPTEFFPPTSLESAARAIGAPANRYLVDYLMLPMRDAVRLATVVIRPKAAGRYPTVMLRTPYAMTSFERMDGVFKPLFEADYVVVVQNERGSEWSEGEFGFLTNTTADAIDTLDWLETQDWSNGRVGLYGCSSTAENQLKLGAIGHRALRACVPMSSGAGIGSIPGAEWHQGLAYRGGVPMLKSWALWHAPFGIRLRPKLPPVDSDDERARIFRRFSISVPDFRVPEYMAALTKSTMQAPSIEVLRRMGAPLTGFEEFMAAGPTGKAWDAVDLIDARHTGATPSININGWMDIGAYETVKLFEFQQHHPDQYLIMAGTEHCRMTVTSPEAKLGDRPVGDTRFQYDEVITTWFHRWLLDEQDAPEAWKPMPKVQVFLMGAGTWLNADSWPLPETEDRFLYLTSTRGAVTLWGDGALLAEPGADSADVVIADPHNPVPSLGDDLGIGTPVCSDQRSIECRGDVLVYSTPELTEPVSIVGDVSAELYVSADVPDTDVFVKLVDVYPDGTAYNLAQSCLRLRYRDGIDSPAHLLPGVIYRIEIVGITTANYFGAGHRIRLEVAGASFPLADRNWHTGDANELADDGPVANITIHHGADRPSRLRYRAYTAQVDPKEVSAPR